SDVCSSDLVICTTRHDELGLLQAVEPVLHGCCDSICGNAFCPSLRYFALQELDGDSGVLCSGHRLIDPLLRRLGSSNHGKEGQNSHRCDPLKPSCLNFHVLLPSL